MKFIFRKADIIKITQDAITQNVSLSTISNKVTINIDCELKECPAMVDPFWLRQLMVNLIGNSIKYACKGIITINISLESDCYIISVCDQGKGIPELEIDNIFKEYNQAGNPNKTGVGLGLSICKEIVEGHHGEIWAYNNDNVGATIKFTLPLKQEKL